MLYLRIECKNTSVQIYDVVDDLKLILPTDGLVCAFSNQNEHSFRRKFEFIFRMMSFCFFFNLCDDLGCDVIMRADLFILFIYFYFYFL